MEHEPFTEWAALYAMGTLEEEERPQFEAHLATGCRACSALLSELSTVVAALSWAAPAVSPRPALREMLLARVRDAAAPPVPAPPVRLTRHAAGGRWRWAFWAGQLAVACLVGLLGLALYDARLQLGKQQAAHQQLTEALAQERLLTTLIAHTDTRAAPLASPQPATPPAAGWIVWSFAKQRGFMVVHYLPPLPAGKTYQLWAIAGQQVRSATVFQVDTVGHAALLVSGGVVHPERFEITVESTGGVAMPSGPILLHGSL
jgi:anti-sigma-K factor RskA